ncbi:hypothetical protein [Streptomyces sp. A1136]|uniref:hypothetical protein n=1 Tax=Streptomyces sp. A1136 TaxID=2563102 RepID=UPI001F105E73|nr:hypothetical protein [Streptomyces sp. A1136]
MRGLLPDADEEVLRHPVERREARRRGAEVVRFVGARTRRGEVASWADPTSVRTRHRARPGSSSCSPRRPTSGAVTGHAVLAAALPLAADVDCGTRFLTADAADRPREWCERRGFCVIGRTRRFGRV